jgi:hypothetical protein
MALGSLCVATVQEVRFGESTLGIAIVLLIIGACFIQQKKNDKRRFGLDGKEPRSELEFTAYTNQRRRLIQSGYQDVLIKLSFLCGGICFVIAVVSFSIGAISR